MVSDWIKEAEENEGKAEYTGLTMSHNSTLCAKFTKIGEFTKALKEEYQELIKLLDDLTFEKIIKIPFVETYIKENNNSL